MRDAIATRFERCAHKTPVEGSAWAKTPRGKGEHLFYPRWSLIQQKTSSRLQMKHEIRTRAYLGEQKVMQAIKIPLDD